MAAADKLDGAILWWIQNCTVPFSWEEYKTVLLYIICYRKLSRSYILDLDQANRRMSKYDRRACMHACHLDRSIFLNILFHSIIEKTLLTLKTSKSDINVSCKDNELLLHSFNVPLAISNVRHIFIFSFYLRWSLNRSGLSKTSQNWTFCCWLDIGLIYISKCLWHFLLILYCLVYFRFSIIPQPLGKCDFEWNVVMNHIQRGIKLPCTGTALVHSG